MKIACSFFFLINKTVTTAWQHYQDTHSVAWYLLFLSVHHTYVCSFRFLYNIFACFGVNQVFNSIDPYSWHLEHFCFLLSICYVRQHGTDILDLSGKLGINLSVKSMIILERWIFESLGCS